MMRRIAALVLATFGLVLCAPTAAATDHKDERLGFKLKVPRKWQQIPQGKNEIWIVGKFVSDKTDYYNDSATGYTWTHQPHLRVVAFIHELINRPDIEEEDEDDDTSGVRINLGTLFRDYEAYMKGTFSDGFFIGEQEEGEVRGVSVTKLVLNVEDHYKDRNRRIVTWIYHTDIADIAVEFEVLEKTYDDWKSTIEKTLKSFETIERTQELDLNRRGSVYLSALDLAKLTPEDRMLRRREQERIDWERLTQDLPEGWTAGEVDGYKVLNRHDEKFAKKVTSRVEGITNWLEETFEDVGRNEYARRPIIRICEDAEEERHFMRNFGVSIGTNTELVTHKSQYGAKSYEWEHINHRATQIWFQDRDWKLYAGMPYWLRRGIEEVVESAQLKGSKLKFAVDDWERVAIPRISRADRVMDVREVMHMRLKDFRELNGGNFCDAHATVLTRLLLESRRYSEVLPDYLGNLRAVLDEIDAEKKGQGKKEKPKNEEEEEEYFRERRKALAAQEQRILEQAFERTFATWDARDWSRFESDFAKAMD